SPRRRSRAALARASWSARWPRASCTPPARPTLSSPSARPTWSRRRSGPSADRSCRRPSPRPRPRADRARAATSCTRRSTRAPRAHPALLPPWFSCGLLAPAALTAAHHQRADAERQPRCEEDGRVEPDDVLLVRVRDRHVGLAGHLAGERLVAEQPLDAVEHEV